MKNYNKANLFAGYLFENNEVQYLPAQFCVDFIIQYKELIKSGNIRLLSCTKLKDITGKYIMEGDIVEVDTEDSTFDNPITALGVVSYSEGFTSFSLYYPNWHYNNPTDILDYLDWEADEDLTYKHNAKIVGNLLDIRQYIN